MKLKIVYLCLTLLVLAGCAGKRIDLDREGLKDTPISKIDVIDLFNEIQIEKNDSSGAASSLGLIGAVVSGIMDAGINISRENSMKQLRENMLLYDMQESFNEKLSMALADTRHKDANVVNRERDAQLNQNAEAEIRVPKIVFSTTITGDRLRLIIEAIVSFKNSAEKGDVYTRSYYSVHDLGKLGIDKSVKRKTAKLATKTEELAQLIDVSLDELTELFIDDYTDNKLKNLTAVERASPLISKTIFLRKMHIIKDNDNRVLMTSGAEIAPTMLYLDSSLVGKRRVIKK